MKHHANQHGVALAIEPTNPLRADVSIVFSLRDTVRLAREADLGVVIELQACWLEPEFAETVRANIDRVQLVQVSDFAIGTLDTPNRAVPGDGDIPLARLLGTILDSATIMLLTLLVKGLTVPFTTKSMRSMKAMAVLAPQMKALQEKYKDDRQRLQMETMALYKQHGANPLSGCLPILLQMPIWLALYRMLSSTGELYQQPFIPGWINDLTHPDPFYLTPILMGATMFVQQKMTPTTNVDPAQQRMMLFMPLIFTVMFVTLPSGLVLYYFVNNLLGIGQQWLVNRHVARLEAAPTKA